MTIKESNTFYLSFSKLGKNNYAPFIKNVEILNFFLFCKVRVGDLRVARVPHVAHQAIFNAKPSSSQGQGI